MAEPLKIETFFNARYVGLKSALDQLGGRVEWDNAAKRATVHVNAKTILVTMGEINVEANGQTFTLSQPPLIEDGTLYVPVEFFSDVVGQIVSLA